MCIYIFILGLYQGYIGIMEKKMETSRMGYTGYILGLCCCSILPFQNPAPKAHRDSPSDLDSPTSLVEDAHLGVILVLGDLRSLRTSRFEPWT